MTYSYGGTPPNVITAACKEQCPKGYPMVIKSQTEWSAIASAWNQGIDSHLEALSKRSSADPYTGKVLIHPEELHVLLRRLGDSDNEEANMLRVDILTTLGIEEI